MAITALNIIARQQLTNANATYYTSPASTGTIIDKCTLTNVSAAPVAVSINLVASGGVVGATNIVLSSKTLQVNECYTCPEIVGQFLPSGGFLSAIAGASAAVVISATGRQIT